MKGPQAHPPASATSRLPQRRLLLAGTLALTLLWTGASPAQAQEDVQCEDALAKASDLFYKNADFEAAIDLLESCLQQKFFSDEERPEVYKLLVLINHAKGLEQQWKAVLAQLLELVPTYKPDPGDPPWYKDSVEELKREMAPPVEAPPVKAPPVVEVMLAREQDPAVRNIRLEQEDGRVVVAYELVGTGKKYEVRLLLSTDGARSFEALPRAVTGDVGKGIRPGAGKQIVWAALADFPEGLAGAQYRLQVEAKKQRGQGMLYALGGAAVAGAGVTVALLLGGGGGDNGNGIPMPEGRPPGGN